MPRTKATAAETQRRKQHTYMISYDIIIYSNSLSFNEHQLSGSIVYISSLTAQHAYKSLGYGPKNTQWEGQVFEQERFR